jgi:hypothetical protein
MAASISLVKSPFPPRFRKRAILDHVARGFDDDDFELVLRWRMRRGQHAHNLARLRESQRRSPCADLHRTSAIFYRCPFPTIISG